MAQVACPRCDTRFALAGGWAAAAVATLVAAPAVPDMATQVRCPHCQLVFGASDVRHQHPPYAGLRAAALWAVGVVLLLAWLH
jgi:uncharacterized C2H2 Zn-finger protein